MNADALAYWRKVGAPETKQTLVNDAQDDMLAKMGKETIIEALAHVNAEEILNDLADTAAEVEAETLRSRISAMK